MKRAVLVHLSLASLLLWRVSYAAEPRPGVALDQPISNVSIVGPLREAFSRVEQLAGVSIQVDWAALAAAGVTGDTKVVIHSASATPRQLLSMVLLQAAAKDRPLGWYLRDNVIHVTTQQRALSAGREMPALMSPAAGRASSTGQAAAPVRPKGIDLDLHDTPLKQAVEFFRNVSGLNFYVNWAALESLAVTRETPVSVSVRGVTLGKGLDLVVEQLAAGEDPTSRVYWVVDRGVVMISTGAALDSQMRTRVWDVTDLVWDWSSRDFSGLGAGVTSGQSAAGQSYAPGPAAGGASSPPGQTSALTLGADRQGATGAGPVYRGDSLIEVIKGAIGPEMWQPQGKGSISIYNGKLVITQSLLGFKLLEDAGWH